MGSKQFVPLSANLIDEGELLTQLDTELREAMEGLVKFRKEHGDRAHKAKATVSVDVELVCTDTENGAYQINWKMKKQLPKRPTKSSFAVDGGTEDGVNTLFVRTSGSDDSHPSQMKLATRDGRVVDQETGEPLD